MKNIVVIGGGTGSYTVLSSLKLINNINITAIVASTDSGGSSGILKDEFGNLPVGDFRQCLVALADEDKSDNALRDLFLYRFDKGGTGLQGHNFGNLFITALTDILKNEEAAFDYASKILNIKGSVYPVTFDKIELLAEYENGEIAFGEKNIDQPPKRHDGKLRINKLWSQPKAILYSKTKEAILKSDIIILGPGDLYTSTIANLVIDDLPSHIKKSKAKIIYIVNLVTKYGQTHTFTTKDHVNEIEKYLDKKIDLIIINKKKLPKIILSKYNKEKAFPVQDTLENDHRVVYSDLLSKSHLPRHKSDKVRRSFIRHDIHKLSKTLEKLIIPN